MRREAMKHTPGPWRLCYDGQIDGSDGHRICKFDWDSFGEFNKSNNAANSRLIAAAPDLLEALKMVRDADDDCKRDGLPTIPPAARATIDAAIAKATGGEA